MSLKQLELRDIVNELIYETGIPYSASQRITRVLPSGVSEIRIKHRSGSLSGGSSGSLIANTVITEIKLTVGGQVLLDYSGDVDTDLPDRGIQIMRIYNKALSGVADGNEYFIIRLPDALPEERKVELSFRFNSIANINDGDRTTYSNATVDITFMKKDAFPGMQKLLRTSINKFILGTGTDQTFYPEATFKDFVAKYLALVTEDNSVDSNTAINEIIITKGKEVLFEGTFGDLQQKALELFGVAMATGEAILPLFDEIWSTQELKVRIKKSSGGTAVDIHYAILQEGLAQAWGILA